MSEIVDRQELAARATMARSEHVLWDAIALKQATSQRTAQTLKQQLPHGLRDALIRASVRVSEQHDQAIEQCESQVEVDSAVWSQQRRRSGSIAKLLDRIERREQLASDRASERELADLISSRAAMVRSAESDPVRSAESETSVGRS